MRAQSEAYWLEKFITPSGSVHCSGPWKTSSGSRNAFQLVTSASTLTVASAGRDSGTTIRQRNPNVEHPSTRAASSSSFGMLPKNGPQDDDRERERERRLRQRHAQRVAEEPEAPQRGRTAAGSRRRSGRAGPA